MDIGSTQRPTSSPSRLSELKSFFRNTVTSADRHVVSQFLLDAEEEMKGYDVEMDRLQTAIHVLKAKKKGLRKTMEKCQSLLAPVHRLPAEILTMIFSSACEPNELVPLTIAPAVALSSVSGRWREILLGSAGIWADLSIYFPAWKNKLYVLERILHVFMTRSKSHPLTLDLQFEFEHTDQASGVFDILFRHRTRWQSVFLRTIPADLFHQNATNTLCLPTLRTLELSTYTAGPSLHGIFQNASALRTVTLRNERLMTSQLALPWHQIESLSLWNGPTDTILEFLSLFPHLATLKLGWPEEPEIQSRGFDHLICQTLKALSLMFVTQADLDNILPFLTLPALTSFDLSSSQFDPTLDTTSLINFLTRSACPITTLSLDSLRINVQELIAVLELLPTVSSLEMREEEERYYLTSELINRFVVDHERLLPGPTFLPLLTDLSLLLDKKNFFEQELFEVVTSRWIPDPIQADELGVKCLRSVSVVLWDKKNGDLDIKSLRCFRAAGLRLQQVCRGNEPSDSE